ncbi:MAG: ribonuclease Y [Clostridia bacterium]|nr:ribonuclease Y [Clostridia bacterium]
MNIVNFSTLCASVPVAVPIILSIIMLAVGVGAGYGVYAIVMNKKSKSAKMESDRILAEAHAQAEKIKKEQVELTNKEISILKSTFEQENKERREEAKRSEERLYAREEMLSKREESLDKKLEELEQSKERVHNQIEALNSKENALDELQGSIIKELEKVSQMTTEQAKQVIIDRYTEEAKIEAVKLAKEIEDRARDEADKKARNIITLAIQKCAADHTSEVTTSTVTLPSEEMKGRIIGREGRNIRALEAATGIDFIVDDTPEAITLSGFDPIRREVARIALEKLILDGRIHPARIEELVQKVQKDVEETIKEAGENACFDADIHNIHPEIVKVLGRLKYRTSYGQNVLNHALEVSFISGMLAAEIGANEKVARRAGLLHDLGKAVDHEVEGTHVSIGVELARKYKESEAVIHCIEAHHNDVEPKTLEAVIVQAADAISSARPGARRESIENYIKRLQELEAIANAHHGVDKTYAIQAGREIRVMVKPEHISDDEAQVLAHDIAKEIEAKLEYPGHIKVNVIRESRFTDTAK